MLLNVDAEFFRCRVVFHSSFNFTGEVRRGSSIVRGPWMRKRCHRAAAMPRVVDMIALFVTKNRVFCLPCGWICMSLPEHWSCLSSSAEAGAGHW